MLTKNTNFRQKIKFGQILKFHTNIGQNCSKTPSRKLEKI